MRGAHSRSSDPMVPFALGLSNILERAPTVEELTKFERYLFLLHQWNQVHRLTAYRGREEIVQKLFLDSLLFLKVLPPTALRVLDFGTGAGIPGIPLKIVLPHIDLTLLEARRNRASFLTAVLRELGFQEVALLHGRAEQFLVKPQELRGTFDAVVAKAAGPLATVVPAALPFLRPGGVFIVSGPPVYQGAPKLPRNTPTSWKLVQSYGGLKQRRFLLVEKEN